MTLISTNYLFFMNCITIISKNVFILTVLLWIVTHNEFMLVSVPKKNLIKFITNIKKMIEHKLMAPYLFGKI